MAGARGNWATWWAAYGGDSARLLEAVQLMARPNVQVADLQANYTVVMPGGAVRKAAVYLTGDGKCMQSMHRGDIGHKCWLCEDRTNSVASVVPRDDLFGAFKVQQFFCQWSHRPTGWGIMYIAREGWSTCSSNGWKLSWMQPPHLQGSCVTVETLSFLRHKAWILRTRWFQPIGSHKLWTCQLAGTL